MVETDGYHRLTIRALARDLGVAPMSLYRHVQDKDDLLEEVVDRLLADIWRPRAPASDWKLWVSEAAEKFRHFLVSEPAALHTFLQHPVTTQATIDRMEAMVAVLCEAGFFEPDARAAYATIHTYTIGFAAFEVSRERSAGRRSTPRAAEFAAFSSPRQFAQGLDCLIAGIEATYSRH